MVQEDLEDDDFTSKSQKKRDSKDVQVLARKLCELPKKVFNEITLDDNIHNAIKTAQKLRPSAALNRQIQYIAKCLKQVDLDAIKETIYQLENKESLQKHQLKKIENWREKLIETNDSLGDFINQYHNVDRQQLRQVIRNARKEIETKKSTKAFKQLYQIVKEALIN
jgi:ribosome-associated protein